jgi:hypothetical protein
MELLGFIINAEGVRMDPDRLKTIREWQEPPIKIIPGRTGITWVLQHLQKIHRRYSHISRPLTSQMEGCKNGKKTSVFNKE